MSLPAEKKAGAVQLPPGSEPRHRAITKKAAEVLGRFVDGNGLKAAQIRLAREETHIHGIPAGITVTLATEILTKQVKGNAPQGTVVATAAEATAGAAAAVKDMMKEPAVRAEINDSLKKDAGHGFGLPPLTLRLASQRKVFSVVGACQKCGGAAFTGCKPCNGSGSAACLTCGGNGFSSCRWCNGAGRMPGQSGSIVGCAHCQNGQVSCPNCRGNRFVTCPTCRGQGKTGCADCGQTGAATEIYQVEATANCTFDVDWREVASDVRGIVHKLGLRELATKGHAEIIWQEPETRPADLYVPCTAFLPIATAEFMVEGQAYPARIAGLRGRIIEIGPILDKYVKPGIAALMKLSKGPLAQQALIDTACKYRLIRQVLAGLTRESRKRIYQRLGKSYPLMLSDKYARATVKYAAVALAALSTGPRYKGLAAGTVIAALPAALYCLTPLRHLLMTSAPRYIFAIDIAVWLAGWGIAVYTIRLVTAQALRKVLPETVLAGKAALPSAGKQGYMALASTALVWCMIATVAAEKPAWLLALFGGGS